MRCAVRGKSAAEDIPLAAFAAITHGKSPGGPIMLKALSAALKTVDEETALLFSELIELGLGEGPAAVTWRELMAIPLSFFRSETSQQLRAQGRDQGRAEGRAEALLLVLDRREVAVSQEVRDRITGCDDPAILDEWLGRAVTVARAEDVFGED